jgi:hypothetical protein
VKAIVLYSNLGVLISTALILILGQPFKAVRCLIGEGGLPALPFTPVKGRRACLGDGGPGPCPLDTG